VSPDKKPKPAPESKAPDGDVEILREFRQRNQNGNCVYCAAEDVFWGAAGLESFKGLRTRAIDSGWHGAGLGNVLAYAKQVGVPVKSQHGQRGEYQILEDGVANGTGCYIEIPGHAICVVGISAGQWVDILDNNGSLEYERKSWSRFNQRWEGSACYPVWNKRQAPKWKEVDGMRRLFRGRKFVGSWNPLTQVWWVWDGKIFSKAAPPWEKP